MTDHDRDPLIDELRAALDVAPSAEFAARVRRAVGARRTYGWWIAVAGAGLAGVAALAVFSITPHKIVKPLESSAVNPQPTVSPPMASATAPAIMPSSRKLGASSEAAHGVQERSVRATDPEVLIPPDEGLALRRLLLALRSRSNQVPPATRPAEDAEGRLLKPAPLTMPPIVIPSLEPRRDRTPKEKR